MHLLDSKPLEITHCLEHFAAVTCSFLMTFTDDQWIARHATLIYYHKTHISH